MLRLAQAADVVLMDLRGFTPQNRLRYELQQLLDFVALERVLVLIDADAPRDFIEGTLAALWQASRADSPNRAAMPARVRPGRWGGTTVARLVDAFAGGTRPAAAGESASPRVRFPGVIPLTDDEGRHVHAPPDDQRRSRDHGELLRPLAALLEAALAAVFGDVEDHVEHQHLAHRVRRRAFLILNSRASQLRA